MRKRMILGAACAALLALGLVTRREAEPTYQGRRLSELVRDLRRDDTDAEEGLRRIGTNALPYLVRWIQIEPPGEWRVKAADRLRFWPRVASCVRGDDQMQLALGAGWALERLGTRAATAAPELERLAESRDARVPARRAMMALLEQGTNCVPFFIRIAGIAGHPQQGLAVFCLRVLAGKPENWSALASAVPTMVSCLGCAKDEEAREEAATALGLLRVAPEVEVTPLVRALGDGNAVIRAVAAVALGQYGGEAASGLEALTNCLASREPFLRACAGRAISSIVRSAAQRERGSAPAGGTNEK